MISAGQISGANEQRFFFFKSSAAKDCESIQGFTKVKESIGGWLNSQHFLTCVNSQVHFEMV